MNEEAANNTKNKYLIPGLIIIGIAFIIRFLFLESDPPYFFSRTSQDLLADPYNYIHFARNKILYGQWEIFDYSRWIIFKNTLVTLISYFMFMIGGVSRVTANLTGVILSTSGLSLFALSHLKRSKTWFILTAVILFTNITLISFGRYPFLETALIFYCGLIYFLFNKYHSSQAILYISGILLALCGLTGKMFGMVLIVPMAFIIWNNNRLGFIRQFGILLVSTVVSFFVFALMFYGGQFGSLFGFMGEHAAGIYGFPEVISSPVKFVEHLISFGRESRMFFFSPFLLILIYLSLTIIILDWKIIKTQRNNELLFCLGWLASGYLFLMLFNYRPLRYQLYLLMPTAGIIGYLISYYKNIKFDFEPNYKNIGLLFLLWWSFFSHIIFIVGVYFLDLTLSAIVVWYALPLAILTIIILYFIKKTFVGIFNKVPSYLLIVLGLMILFQSISVYKWFNKRTYNLYEAGQSLAYDIAEDAILIGPYAHALTIDNNIKSFIYWFGMAQKEPRLFADFPVTHITADLSNWNELFKEYPFLKGSIHWVSNYRIRNIETRVARMPDDYMATYHPNYRQTDYERGIKYFHLANVDSTIFYLGRCLEAAPDSKSANILMAGYYLNHGQLDKGFDVFDRLILLYPRDYSICMEAGSYHYNFYHIFDNENMLIKADEMFDRAISINPFCKIEVQQFKSQTDSVYAEQKNN